MLKLDEAEKLLIQTFEGYIFAHQTYYGVCAIGDFAEEINKTSFANTFGTLQGELDDLAYVRICALYETSTRNKTTSIPHLVRALKDAETIEGERSGVFLNAYGRQDITADEDLPWKRLERFVSSEMQSSTFRDAFSIVRTVRDKRIAHSEAQKTEAAVKYEQMDHLFEIARRSIQLAGAIYYNENIRPDGELIPGADLKRNGLKRLIKRVISADPI